MTIALWSVHGIVNFHSHLLSRFASTPNLGAGEMADASLNPGNTYSLLSPSRSDL